MSLQVTEAFVRQYSDSFLQVYQQTQSELENTVRRETQNSEFKFWDFIGPTTVQWDPARHAETPLISTPHSRRRCSLRKAVWADMVDDLDEIMMLKNPTSDYIQAAVAAMQRAKDERILEAFGAIVYTGKEGSVAVNNYDVGECRVMLGDGTWATAGAIETGTTETGLTLAKLGSIGAVMDNASVPATDRHLVCNSAQKWVMLGTTKVTSVDYATVKALTTGEVDSFMGFKFHFLPDDRFTSNAVDTGCFDCFAYHRDAILLATGKDIRTRVSEMADRNYSVQAYADMTIGAVRLRGPGVVKVLLDKDAVGSYA